jgi:hypothetical protein
MNSTDILIIISIHLFVLSLINEKFTNFLKLNLQSIYESRKDFWFLKIFLWSKSSRNKFKSFLRNNLKNLRIPEGDKEKEKLRERGVTNLTIICGIITATFAGADLFHLIKNAHIEENNMLLNWTIFFEKLEWVWERKVLGKNILIIGKAILNHGFGFIFSGLFLSLGSKFWHDLLDILFQAKSMKGKLNDSRTFNAESADEVQEFILTSNSQLRKLAIEQNQKLFDNDDILYTTHSDRIINGRTMDCIGVFIKKGSRVSLPDRLKVKLEKSGFETFVPIVVYEIDDIPKIHFGRSALMEVDASFAGSSCCLLTVKNKNQTFLLTCCHNFTEGSLDFSFSGWAREDTRLIEVQEEEEIIGTVSYALLDKTFDIALVDVTNRVSDYSPRITLVEVAQETEYFIGRKAFFDGFVTNGNAFGFITSIFNSKQEIPVEYNDGRINLMTNLIEFSTSPDSQGFSPSKSGDSGGLIYDENRRAIALILAGSSKHSYAIPIHSITQKLTASLFKNN